MLACFIALLAHTMAYAGFLEDPLTWVLLAIGGALAAGPQAATERAAVLAAFIALLVHTMAYAGFYEDPITWVLLAVGLSLAQAPVRDGP